MFSLNELQLMWFQYNLWYNLQWDVSTRIFTQNCVHIAYICANASLSCSLWCKVKVFVSGLRLALVGGENNENEVWLESFNPWKRERLPVTAVVWETSIRRVFISHNGRRS